MVTNHSIPALLCSALLPSCTPVLSCVYDPSSRYLINLDSRPFEWHSKSRPRKVLGAGSTTPDKRSHCPRQVLLIRAHGKPSSVHSLPAKYRAPSLLLLCLSVSVERFPKYRFGKFQPIKLVIWQVGHPSPLHLSLQDITGLFVLNCLTRRLQD